MKIKEGFVLREVAGDVVVIPTGDTLDLNMMITLNETARFLWERLEQGAEENELVQAILAVYDTTVETAQNSVASFLKVLRENDLLQ